MKLEPVNDLGSCEFIMGSASPGDFPPADRPEICFAGRSNVGKSSLINALTRRRKLARISNTPGRTRQINFFLIGDSRYLVDLPGYGFARMSKSEARNCGVLIDNYLYGRPSLRRAFLLIDARRGIMPIDQQFMHRLGDAAVAFQVILTKADKAARGLPEIEDSVTEALTAHPAAIPTPISTSSVRNTGIENLRRSILELV